MVNIQTIPIKELKKDLKESLEDIDVCIKAIALGITQYSGGEVQKRLDDNKHFTKVITTEIERRRLFVST